MSLSYGVVLRFASTPIYWIGRTGADRRGGVESQPFSRAGPAVAGQTVRLANGSRASSSWHSLSVRLRPRKESHWSASQTRLWSMPNDVSHVPCPVAVRLLVKRYPRDLPPRLSFLECATRRSKGIGRNANLALPPADLPPRCRRGRAGT